MCASGPQTCCAGAGRRRALVRRGRASSPRREVGDVGSCCRPLGQPAAARRCRWRHGWRARRARAAAKAVVDSVATYSCKTQSSAGPDLLYRSGAAPAAATGQQAPSTHRSTGSKRPMALARCPRMVEAMTRHCVRHGTSSGGRTAHCMLTGQHWYLLESRSGSQDDPEVWPGWSRGHSLDHKIGYYL